MSAAGARRPAIEESLRVGVELSVESGRIIIRRRGYPDLALTEMPVTRLVAERLAAGWHDAAALDALADESEDPAQVYYVIAAFRRAGLLQMRCCSGDRELFLLTPAPDPACLMLPVGSRYRLSPFACLHRDGSDLMIEMPLSRTRCVMRDRACLEWLLSAARAAVPAPGAELASFAAALLGMKAIVEEREESAARETWQFHDLLFHHASSLGYLDVPYGGTWRLEQACPSAPLFKPVTDACIALSEPNPAQVEHLRRPFGEVLASRRSERPASPRPLALPGLAALLGTAARAQKALDDPKYPCTASLRPSPSGGALHSIEIYLLARECDGLEKGAYRYDPERHRLECVPAEKKALDAYLALSPFASAPEPGLPAVQLIFTSRFLRVAWKYERNAYRLALLDLGCLYQTLGLSAAALGLATCILGAVDAPRVAALLRLDPLTEPPLGAMALSAR